MSNNTSDREPTTTDIVDEIIQREKGGIAGSTEVRAGMEIVELRAERARLRAAVAFARTVIKCGEPWTDVCEQELKL
jgi:hypothetical protein